MNFSRSVRREKRGVRAAESRGFCVVFSLEFAVREWRITAEKRGGERMFLSASFWATCEVPNSLEPCVFHRTTCASRRRTKPACRSQRWALTNLPYRFYGRATTVNSEGRRSCRRVWPWVEFAPCKTTEKVLGLARRNLPMDWPGENLARRSPSRNGLGFLPGQSFVGRMRAKSRGTKSIHVWCCSTKPRSPRSSNRLAW